MQEQCNVSIREIDAASLHQLLEAPNISPPLLIDVRQPQEFEQGHIPGALLIPLGQLEMPHPALSDPARPIVVYCRSGKRSMLGATILCARGFQEVMSLQHGILGWHYETLVGPPKAALRPGEDNSVRDILTGAMGRELEAQKLYRQWLSHTEETAMKSILQELAEKEEEHSAALYNRYLAWCRENAAAPLSRAEMEETAINSRGGENSALHISNLPFSSREDLLELAVEKEFEAYSYYKTAAEMIGSIELRELLIDLSFEERIHASSLLQLLG